MLGREAGVRIGAGGDVGCGGGESGTIGGEVRSGRQREEEGSLRGRWGCGVGVG